MKLNYDKSNSVCSKEFVGKGLMPNGEVKMFSINCVFDYTNVIYVPFKGVDIGENLDIKKSRFRGSYNYMGENLPLHDVMKPELRYLMKDDDVLTPAGLDDPSLVLVDVPKGVFFKEMFDMPKNRFYTFRYYKKYFADLGFEIVDKFSGVLKCEDLIEHLVSDINGIPDCLEDLLDTGITSRQIIETLNLPLPPNASLEEITNKFLQAYSKEIQNYKFKVS